MYGSAGLQDAYIIIIILRYLVYRDVSATTTLSNWKYSDMHGNRFVHMYNTYIKLLVALFIEVMSNM